MDIHIMSIITLALCVIWIYIIVTQIKITRRIKKHNMVVQQLLYDEIYTRIAKGYEYEYSKPYTPKLPTYVEDLKTNVWLSTQIVKVTKTPIIGKDRVLCDILMKSTEEKYFTSEYACIMKLKNENIEHYFK